MPIYEFEGKRPKISETSFVHPAAVLIGGENCIIRSGCVITDNQVIPPEKLVVGVPGRIIGEVNPAMTTKRPGQNSTKPFRSGTRRR